MGKQFVVGEKHRFLPRIKHKKLVIFFSVILIGIGAFLIKAFTQKGYALAEEGDSFEIIRPSTGSPSDYSPLDNTAIAIWSLKNCNNFKSSTTGTVKPSVAGEQALTSGRIVNDDIMYSYTTNDGTISVNTECYYENDEVVIRNNNKKSYSTVSTETYLGSYGWLPSSFSAYVINEKTISTISMKEESGKYIIDLQLDPSLATACKQKETKMVSGLAGYPGYSSCHLVVTIDNKWNVVQVDTKEIYNVVYFGVDAKCTGTMTEVFEYGEFEIPGQAEFRTHLGEVSDTIPDSDPDFTTIIGAITAQNNYAISIEALGEKYDGNIYLSISTGKDTNGEDKISATVKAKIGDLSVYYLNDSLYLKIGDKTYQLAISDLTAYLSSGTGMDTDSLLNDVMATPVKVEGNTITAVLNLNLGEINVSATIVAEKNENDYKIKSINGSVNLLGKEIKLSLTPSTEYKFEEISASTNLKSILWIIDEIKDIMKNNVALDINASIGSIDITGNVIIQGKKVSGSLSIKDIKVDFYYENEVIYIVLNDIKVKASIDDLSSILKKFVSTDNISISKILPVIKTLSIDIVNETKFNVGVNLSSLIEDLENVALTISKSQTKGIDLSTKDNINIGDLSVGLKCTVLATANPATAHPDGDYINVKDLDWLMDEIKKLVDAEVIGINVDGKLNLLGQDITIKGNVYITKDLKVEGLLTVNDELNVKINYLDEVIYLEIGNIKLKLNINDIKGLMDKFDTSNIDLTEIINSLSLTSADKELLVGLDLLSLGKLDISIKEGINVKVKDISVLVKADTHEFNEITGTYEDLSNLEWLVDGIKGLVDGEKVEININGEIKGIKVSGSIVLDDNFNVYGTIKATIKDMDLLINVYMQDKVIYLEYNNVKVQASLSSIMDIVGKFTGAIDLNTILDKVNEITIDYTNGITLNITDKISIKLNKDMSFEALGFTGTITTSDKEVKEPSGEYIDVEDLDWLIDEIKELVNAEAYLVTLNASFKEFVISGQIVINKDFTMQGTIKVQYQGKEKLIDVVTLNLYFKDKDIYVTCGNINIKININDIEGLIKTVCATLELDAPNIDIEKYLKELSLEVLEEALTATIDTKVLKITANEGLNITLDDMLEAKITTTTKQTITIPDVTYLTIDDINLMVEYVDQLLDIVNNMKYHIGFTLDVNGYQVYAEANIIAGTNFKLYGKAILLHEDGNYFLELYIVDGVVTLEFSQTFTVAKNPLDSTITQSICFKINFDELMTTLREVLSGIGISNDMIDTLLTYLEKIVNVGGNISEIIEGEAKSLDLSAILGLGFDTMIKGITVSDDNLIVQLAGDQYLSINRTNNTISSLHINKLEINSDVLTADFNWLPDADIVVPTKEDCLNLNGISGLVHALLNLYKLGEVEASGKVNLKLFGFTLSDVTIKALLDFDNNGAIKGAISIDVPKIIFVTKASTKTKIFIQDGYVYLSRTTSKTETRKMTTEDFLDDILNQIVWIFNFSDLVGGKITDAAQNDTGGRKVEEIITGFNVNGNKYSVKLDGPALVGTDLFSDINIDLTRSTQTVNGTADYYLTNIYLETNILSIIGIELDLDVINIGKTLDWSWVPSDSTLQGYTAYSK